MSSSLQSAGDVSFMYFRYIREVPQSFRAFRIEFGKHVSSCVSIELKLCSRGESFVESIYNDFLPEGSVETSILVGRCAFVGKK